MGAAAIVMKYDTIHHVLGKDNFALISSKGSFGGKPTSFYDLFRVADGKVAEHWGTIEAIPARPTGRTRTASSRPCLFRALAVAGSGDGLLFAARENLVFVRRTSRNVRKRQEGSPCEVLTIRAES
jgi:hypothetical protein